MTITRNRGLLLLLGLVAACLLLASGESANAQSPGVGCTVPDQFASTRSCTFMERYGQCLSNSLSSYYDCRRYASRRSGWLGRMGARAACEGGVQVDLFVCHLRMPLYAFRQMQGG